MPGPLVRIFVEKAVDKQRRPTSYVCQEYDSCKVTEDILGREAEVGTKFSFAIILLLLSGDGERLPVGTSEGRFGQISRFFRVVNTVPPSQEDK